MSQTSVEFTLGGRDDVLIVILVSVTLAVLFTFLGFQIYTQRQGSGHDIYPTYSYAHVSPNTDVNLAPERFTGPLTLPDPVARAQALLATNPARVFLDLRPLAQQPADAAAIAAWGTFVATIATSAPQVTLVLAFTRDTFVAGSWTTHGEFTPPGSVLSRVADFSLIFVPERDLNLATSILQLPTDAFVGFSFDTNEPERNQERVQEGQLVNSRIQSILIP